MSAPGSKSLIRQRLGVSVIGAGRWGKNLVRVFGSLERADLVSVCDSDASVLASLDPSVHKVSSFSQVLSDAHVDAVVIATPTGTHVDLAIAAFEAGKHVFVEKPMALSTIDARRMLRAARLSQRRGMIGFVLHYHPAVEELRRWMAGGLLGRVQRMISVRHGVHARGTEPNSWWSLAPHDVSLARFLFGREPTSVALTEQVDGSVVGMRARLAFDGPCEAEIRVADGARDKVRRLIVVGTEATALFDDLRPEEKLCLYGTAEAVEDMEGLRPQVIAKLPSTEPLRAEAVHFVHALLAGAPFRTDVSDGARVVAVLEAGQTSLASGGRAVRLEDRVAVSSRVQMTKRIAGL
jgi:predicted dehydrogenase